jgi:NAD(P)-dependent dehydrogenase (short-subunit alcohol dehydrogenase family)
MRQAAATAAAAADMQGAGVLITGGSRGLGRALGAALAARGARVVLVARDAAPLHAAVDEIRAAGGEAHAIVADVGAPDAAAHIAGAAQALLEGPIHAVFHNASTLGPLPLRPLLEVSADEFARTLAVNLLGPFRLTQALVGQMLLHGKGLVVHISSDAAIEAYSGWGVYSVSKAALDHLGRVWAAELGAQGIRFVLIDPGEMDTQMHADAMPEADPTTLSRPARVAAALLSILPDATSGARLSLAEVL